VLADDHVARINVPMQDAARVGVIDRVADIVEAVKELPQAERPSARVASHGLNRVESIDGLLKAVAADEAHGVVRPSVGVSPQTMDGDDSRVLQTSSDFSFHQEPLATDRVIGVLVEDLLEGHFSVQLAVQGD
jgi:hypothetical protein